MPVAEPFWTAWCHERRCHGTHVLSHAFPCPISKSRWVTCLIQTARLRGMFHGCQHLISPRKKALKVFTTRTKLSGILEQLWFSLALQRHLWKYDVHCKSFLKVLRFYVVHVLPVSRNIRNHLVSVFITFHSGQKPDSLYCTSRWGQKAAESPGVALWAKPWGQLLDERKEMAYLGLSVQKTGHVPENGNFWEQK